MPDIDQLRERQEQRLLPVLEYWDAGGKHPGSIQVECRSSSANDEVIHSRHSTCGLDKSEVAPAIADYAGPLLVRLPPSPFRSLGGYFSYEGWPDQQRFMELDEALRRKAYENPQGCKPKTYEGPCVWRNAAGDRLPGWLASALGPTDHSGAVVAPRKTWTVMGCAECLRLKTQFECLERAYESALDLLALSPITTMEPANQRLREASDKAGIASQAALVQMDWHRRTHRKNSQ